MRHNVRPSTHAFYRTLSEVHLDDLASLPVSKVSPGDIRRLIADRLEAGYSPRTVRGIVDVLRMILKQAVEIHLTPCRSHDRWGKPRA